MSKKANDDVQNKAQSALDEHRKQGGNKQIFIWLGALVLGGVLGALGNAGLNEFFNFIATVFTRLFQFIAVPTIGLAVITTLASLGAEKDTGRIFGRTITYTLLTTIAASAVAMVLYMIVAPGNLPADIVGAAVKDVPKNLGKLSYYDHFLSIVPNNILNPGKIFDVE